MTELQTARLSLRPLRADDLNAVVTLGADARVMNSMGGPLSYAACQAWLERQLVHWEQHRYGRCVVTHDAHFVGFVGLSCFDFELGLVPGVEVAWRLAFAEWGNGYATEAARAVLDHGFSQLGLREIVGVTSVDNVRSRRVMDRLGMQHAPHETFAHPHLPIGDPLRTHVVYRLSAPTSVRV